MSLLHVPLLDVLPLRLHYCACADADLRSPEEAFPPLLPHGLVLGRCRQVFRLLCAMRCARDVSGSSIFQIGVLCDPVGELWNSGGWSRTLEPVCVWCHTHTRVCVLPS